MKRSKVLLCAPNLLVNEGELNRIEPPLGLLLFAPLLIKDGHEVLIKDFALEGWDIEKLIDSKNKRYLKGQTDEYIAKTISDFNPDVIGISVLYSSLIDSAKDVARIAKRVNPNIKVIVGGNCISPILNSFTWFFISSIICSVDRHLVKFPYTSGVVQKVHFSGHPLEHITDKTLLDLDFEE